MSRRKRGNNPKLEEVEEEDFFFKTLKSAVKMRHPGIYRMMMASWSYCLVLQSFTSNIEELYSMFKLQEPLKNILCGFGSRKTRVEMTRKIVGKVPQFLGHKSSTFCTRCQLTVARTLGGCKSLRGVVLSAMEVIIKMERWSRLMPCFDVIAHTFREEAASAT